MNKQDVFTAVIEKYKDVEESHLDNMSVTELCEHRQFVSNQLKKLEVERKLVDESIMDYLSEAELKRGISLKSGSTLKMRNRTSYQYPESVSMEISELRRFSRESGEAQPETSTYLVLIGD